MAPKCEETWPVSGRRKKRRILSRLWLSWPFFFRNALSTAGNSMSSSERPSPEPILKKRGVPSCTGAERILEALWKPQMPWIIGLGASQPYSRGNSRKRSESVSGVFPEFLREFLPESPTRTGGIRGRKKPININNLAGLSRKWVKLFMCFPFSWRKRETHKQHSQEISGKGRESPGRVPG